jgi:hypothetical protein
MLARQHDKYEALTPVIARPGTAFLAEKGATWHASTFGDVQFAVSLSNFDTAQTSRPGGVPAATSMRRSHEPSRAESRFFYRCYWAR